MYLVTFNPLGAFYHWDKWLFINLTFFPLSFSLGLHRGIFQLSLGNKDTHLNKFTIYLGLILMSYLFLTQNEEATRSAVIIFLLTQYVLLTINHSILFKLNRKIVRKGIGSKNALIVGSDISALNFSENLSDIFGNYYSVKGFVSNGSAVIDPKLKDIAIGNFNNIGEYIKEYNIKQVFIISKSMLEKNYDVIRLACEDYNIQAKMISPYINNLMRQVKVRDVTGVPLTVPSDKNKYRFLYFKLKRFFDKAFTMTIGLIILPISLIISILIKVTSRGPVFFKQKRALYKGGPEFYFYKFRTMYNNADDEKSHLMNKNETNGALFKMKKDPRITPLGRFLRRYSLDEIPQFINVLKGEMSLVGPRPLPIKDFEMIKNGKMNFDWYKKRGEIKPGITGLWQISGRSDLTFEEMCLLDLYYSENQSLLFDLEIIFETIPTMLSGKGAY